MRRVQPITELRQGQSGTVVAVDGGAGIHQRLSALGIYTGTRITKVGSTFSQGPVTVQTAGCQVAIGHGQARRIYVETAGQPKADSENAEPACDGGE